MYRKQHHGQLSIEAFHPPFGGRDVLEAEGLTTANLQKFAGKMAAADDALAYAVRELITRHAAWENAVVLRLPVDALAGKPAALQHRALVELWRSVTGDSGYAPEAETLHNALHSLGVMPAEAGMTPVNKLTFCGMVVEKINDNLFFYRELNAITENITVAPQQSTVWDSRFHIHNTSAAPVTVTALGNVSTATLEKLAPWAAAIKPAAARATLPACDGLPAPLEQTPDTLYYALPVLRSL